jgi:hypothetical protein
LGCSGKIVHINIRFGWATGRPYCLERKVSARCNAIYVRITSKTMILIISKPSLYP